MPQADDLDALRLLIAQHRRFLADMERELEEREAARPIGDVLAAIPAVARVMAGVS